MSYEPWIGAAYKDGFVDKKKLLLVGHSHYRGDLEIDVANDPKFTKTVVKDHLEKEYAFFSHIERVLINLDSKFSKEQRDRFWKRVAFANYFQEALLEPGARPTDAQWDAGNAGFATLLRSIQPDLMFVFSLEVWNRVPTDKVFPGSDNVTQDGSAYLWQVDNHFVLGGGFAHPRNPRVNRPVWHAWAKWLFEQSTRVQSRSK
jgi:hypothetical protein